MEEKSATPLPGSPASSSRTLSTKRTRSGAISGLASRSRNPTSTAPTWDMLSPYWATRSNTAASPSPFNLSTVMPSVNREWPDKYRPQKRPSTGFHSDNAARCSLPRPAAYSRRLRLPSNAPTNRSKYRREAGTNVPTSALPARTSCWMVIIRSVGVSSRSSKKSPSSSSVSARAASTRGHKVRPLPVRFKCVRTNSSIRSRTSLAGDSARNPNGTFCCSAPRVSTRPGRPFGPPTGRTLHRRARESRMRFSVAPDRTLRTARVNTPR